MAKRNRKSQKRRKSMKKRGTRRRIRGGVGEAKYDIKLHLVSKVRFYNDMTRSEAIIYEDRYAPSITDRGMASAMDPLMRSLTSGIHENVKKKKGYEMPHKVNVVKLEDGNTELLKMKTYHFILIDGGVQWIQHTPEMNNPIINDFVGESGLDTLNKLNNKLPMDSTKPTVIINSLGSQVYPIIE